jgi:cullin 3
MAPQGVNSSDVDFDATWQKLEESFSQIHTKNASTLSYEELYRFAYRIVLKKCGDQLYDRVQGFEREWLSNHVRAAIQTSLSPALLSRSTMHSTPATELRDSGLKFMERLKAAWADHVLCMGMIADTLM